MSKEIISATIDKETANEVRELSKQESRSFSKMIDILLKKALFVLKAEVATNKK